MKNKKLCERLSSTSLTKGGVSDASEVDYSQIKLLQKPSQELLEYYKNKAARLENDLDNLSELFDNIKSTCDLSNELQSELSDRNEEVSRLQQVISDLQIHLFREREHCLKLSAENDKLKIQEFEDRKKINALLLLTGSPNSEMIHLLSGNSKSIYIERKLPPKLQKMKEVKASKVLSFNDDKIVSKPEDLDPQALILENHSLAAQLEHHICIFKDQIKVLLKDRELAQEEREIERVRLQKDIDLLSKKLKQTQGNLCETSSVLLKYKQNFEREKDIWMEEKDNYIRTLKLLKEKQDEKYPDVLGYVVSGVGSRKRQFQDAKHQSVSLPLMMPAAVTLAKRLEELISTRSITVAKKSCAEAEFMKEQILEKEQLTASYQEQIIAMEAEINKLRERAQSCSQTFKEKMEKMNAQTAYLKNKYEDLDRRRQLEAEGFRTDIKMLRDRLKDLEKKLAKANISQNCQPSEQQLLISARNTLNRARQLEKELINMKSKIAVVGISDSS